MQFFLHAFRERIAFWCWYLTTYRPIAGADGEGDGGGEGGSGDGSAAGSEGGDGNGDGEGSGEGSGSGGGEGDGTGSESGAGDGGDDGTVPVNKDEFERLKRKVSESEKAERERKRKEAEDAGEHQKVVQQVEQERDEEKSKRETAEAELAKYKSDAEVRKVADSIGFHDSEDAVLRVPQEVAERGEAAIEKHLRDIAKKSPHLVGEAPKRSGAPLSPENGGGGGGGTTLTQADVDQMDRHEIADRWDDVQAFYESQRA